MHMRFVFFMLMAMFVCNGCSLRDSSRNKEGVIELEEGNPLFTVHVFKRHDVFKVMTSSDNLMSIANARDGYELPAEKFSSSIKMRVGWTYVGWIDEGVLYYYSCKYLLREYDDSWIFEQLKIGDLKTKSLKQPSA